jgi:hypothetical protein
MQAMTQGRDGISLAHARALKLMRVARRLSLVAAVFVIAALLVGIAGTSYAKSKKNLINPSTNPRLEDTIVVSNYGAVWYGSIETFAAGAGHSAGPKFRIYGTKTNLGSSTGAAGDSVSSLDAHIAVAIPIDFFDITGCGPFGQPAPGTTSPLLYGTGLAEIFGPTATGNSAPENIICSPNFAFGAPNTTGVFYPQGVAFESPYDGVNPGHDIVAVANQFPVVYGPDSGQAACAPAPTNIEPTKGHPGVCGGGPVGPGSSLGTITEYDRLTLAPGLDNVEPFNNNPVDALNPFSLAPYTQNATIGGCLSLLAGPAGVAFDQTGYLFVVNNAGFDAFDLSCAPRYVTVYAPGAAGDAFPKAVMGLFGATAGSFAAPDGSSTQPIAAAVLSGPISPDTGYPEDIVYVTNMADNSIKTFNPFTNFDNSNFFFQGAQLGTISGPHTKLRAPEGIAIDAAGDALYVVSSDNNSLEMFTDFPSTGGDIPPTLIISGPHSKMNLPVGAALAAFTPTPVPTGTSTVSATRD